MTEKNMIVNYVEKVTVIPGASIWGAVIDGEYRKYNEVNPDMFKPQQIDILRLQAPVLYTDLYPFDFPTQQRRSTMAGSGYLKPETYYRYDNYGNVIELKSIGSKRSSVYIWSYKHRYPIAEIQTGNYTYAQIEAAVKSAFSVTSLEALAQQAIPNETILRNGTLQNALPNALVTTYTYKHLIGMTSATDPGGITVYYNYDNFGRLKNIKDLNSSMMEEYDYHYKE
jgi:YD repeat-containing protein